MFTPQNTKRQYSVKSLKSGQNLFSVEDCFTTVCPSIAQATSLPAATLCGHMTSWMRYNRTKHKAIINGQAHTYGTFQDWADRLHGTMNWRQVRYAIKKLVDAGILVKVKKHDLTRTTVCAYTLSPFLYRTKVMHWVEQNYHWDEQIDHTDEQNCHKHLIRKDKEKNKKKKAPPSSPPPSKGTSVVAKRPKPPFWGEETRDDQQPPMTTEERSNFKNNLIMAVQMAEREQSVRAAKRKGKSKGLFSL